MFYPDRMAERILGMGDIRTLIERADEKISADEQEKAEAERTAKVPLAAGR